MNNQDNVILENKLIELNILDESIEKRCMYVKKY